MVKVKRDFTGQTFGWLYVLRQSEDDYVNPNGDHHPKWICRCKCGNIVEARSSTLTYKGMVSCGCYKRSRKQNRYELNLEDEHGLYGIGYCNNDDTAFYFDMEDYDKIKDFGWYSSYTAKNTNYYRPKANYKDENGNKHTVNMHRLILGDSAHEVVDHIDHNTFNNRKYNLRGCTRRENNCNMSLRSNNTTGISGVHWYKAYGTYLASLNKDGKHHSLGYYDNKDDAIRARLVGEAKYFGEFAPQMHLCEQYGLNHTLLNSPGNDIIKSRRRGNLK